MHHLTHLLSKNYVFIFVLTLLKGLIDEYEALLFQQDEPELISNFEDRKNDEIKRLQTLQVCALLQS